MADQGKRSASGSAFAAVEAGPTSAPGLPARLDAATTPHPSVDALRARFGAAIHHHEVSAGDQHVVYVEAARNREILGWLKSEPSQHYDLLADVTGVDFGEGRPLQVVYQLWSIPHRGALRVKCELPLTALEIDSVEPLWKTANWLEREVYDLFGVEFRGHPDLRRILMPENYAEGHPLRKDFPLRGRFSRAEQTRRALSSDVHDHYIPEELEIGRDPQTVGGTPEHPDLPERGDPNRRAVP
jgi:NADH-quinone oxidoreductase subunit C